MRRPRVTTRRMMVTIAVVAITLAMVPAVRKWGYCRQRAAFHARKEQEFRQLQATATRKRSSIRIVPALETGSEPDNNGPMSRPRSFIAESPERIDEGIDIAPAFEKRAEEHARLKRRFERSAWRPWDPAPAG